jgi:hypothetical protein
VTIEDMPGEFAVKFGGADCWARECVALNCSVENAFYATTDGGGFDRCRVTGPSGTDLDVYAFRLETATVAQVIGCSAFDITAHSGFTGIRVANGERCIVSGNRITNCLGGTASDANEIIQGIIVGADESIVENNYIQRLRSLVSLTSARDAINNISDRSRFAGNMVVDCQSLMANGNAEDAATVAFIEGDTDDYNSNCTFAQSSDFAYSGSNSYKFTKSIAAGTVANVRFHNHADATAGDMSGLVAGCTYRLSARIYIPAASGILGTEISIRLDDDTQAEVTTSCANTYDAWQLVEVTITLGAAATGIMARINAASTAELNEYFYVDEIELVPVGVHNEHGQSWTDGGTETSVVDNSWAQPFLA